MKVDTQESFCQYPKKVARVGRGILCSHEHGRGRTHPQCKRHRRTTHKGSTRAVATASCQRKGNETALRPCLCRCAPCHIARQAGRKLLHSQWVLSLPRLPMQMHQRDKSVRARGSDVDERPLPTSPTLVVKPIRSSWAEGTLATPERHLKSTPNSWAAVLTTPDPGLWEAALPDAHAEATHLRLLVGLE